MALAIPIIAGISGLITGLGGGYLLFDSSKEDTEIDAKGVINNTVEIDKETDSETTWIVRIILLVVILLVVKWCVTKFYRKWNDAQQRVEPAQNNNTTAQQV